MNRHVALLFTDVVDSTSLSSRVGEEAAAVLWREHDRSARDLLRRWRGREIDKSDGFLLLFDQAPDALGYARDYHRLLDGLSTPLKSRVGLHVGNVALRENSPADIAQGAKPLEIDGLAKAVAARVMSVAQGGQTLLTAQAVEALGGESHLHNHGHWRIQGLDDPIELLEVDDPDAPLTPLGDTAKAYRVVHRNGLWVPQADLRHSLPAERDAFVGRHAALLDLAHRLDAGARLVSVLGAGGMGKTRLAQRFGWSWLGEFPGGVWFCDLSAVHSREGIVRAVAEGLGVPLDKVDPLLQVGDALAGRGACLVILDNFEQVVAHAEATLGYWLDHAANARFIATSREALGIPGEEVLPLDSLDPTDAADLFRRRAAAAQRSPGLNEDDEKSILPLVSLLDGMPLAIELAAARVNVMSPSALLKRMHERFSVLVSKGTRRDRQATLRSTLDWSWELLKPFERAALAQLSVFEGSFNIEAAEAVIDLEPWGTAVSAIDTLQSLVDKSLTRARPDQRFDLLVSVREYSAEHLRAEGRSSSAGSPALVAAKRRHVTHFAGIGEAAAVAHHCADLGNLIVACREAVADSDVSSAVRALEAAWAALRLRGPFRLGIELADGVRGMPDLTPEWTARLDSVKGRALRSAGRVREAEACLEAALPLAHLGGDSRTQMRILSQLGDLHVTSGRREEGRAQLTAALALAPSSGDPGTECEVLCGLGNLFESQGELEQARSYYDAALTLARRIGERHWEGGTLGNLGTLCANQGKLAEADAYYRSALSLARELGNRRWEGDTLCNLGLLQQSEGQLARARDTLDAALVLSKEMGYVRLGAVVMCNLGMVHEALGAVDEAREQYDAACAVAQEIGDRRSEGQFLTYLGALNAREGRFTDASRCLDMAERILLDVADRLSLGVLLCSRADAERLSGDGASALATLGRAEAIASEVRAGPESELGRSIAKVRQALSKHGR